MSSHVNESCPHMWMSHVLITEGVVFRYVCYRSVKHGSAHCIIHSNKSYMHIWSVSFLVYTGLFFGIHRSLFKHAMECRIKHGSGDCLHNTRERVAFTIHTNESCPHEQMSHVPTIGTWLVHSWGHDSFTCVFTTHSHVRKRRVQMWNWRIQMWNWRIPMWNWRIPMWHWRIQMWNWRIQMYCECSHVLTNEWVMSSRMNESCPDNSSSTRNAFKWIVNAFKCIVNALKYIVNAVLSSRMNESCPELSGHDSFVREDMTLSNVLWMQSCPYIWMSHVPTTTRRRRDWVPTRRGWVDK